MLIAARDAEATIARAVTSALAEPEVAQVLVVDDGSCDETAARALQCDDGTGRLRLQRSAASGGPADARNRALACARSTWVCPLDADDYFQPGRLGRLLAEAEAADLVADDLLLARNDADAAPKARLIGRRETYPVWLSLTRLLESSVGRRRREYGYLKPLIRLSFLQAHALRYDARLRLGEDLILYAGALAAGGRFRLVEPCGYVAVFRPDSLSFRHTTADLAALWTAFEEFAAEAPLTPEERRQARRLSEHLRIKLRTREVLDARRVGGRISAALKLFRSRPRRPAVLYQLLLGKWTALREWSR